MASLIALDARAHQLVPGRLLIRLRLAQHLVRTSRTQSCYQQRPGRRPRSGQQTGICASQPAAAQADAAVLEALEPVPPPTLCGRDGLQPTRLAQRRERRPLFGFRLLQLAEQLRAVERVHLS